MLRCSFDEGSVNLVLTCFSSGLERHRRETPSVLAFFGPPAWRSNFLHFILLSIFFVASTCTTSVRDPSSIWFSGYHGTLCAQEQRAPKRRSMNNFISPNLSDTIIGPDLRTCIVQHNTEHLPSAAVRTCRVKKNKYGPIIKLSACEMCLPTLVSHSPPRILQSRKRWPASMKRVPTTNQAT